MILNYINHIALVVDKSSSMRHLQSTVVKVFDNEIAYLRRRSVELNQETRISVYLFSDTVECLVFDMDVMRMTSLAGLYQSYGNTALIDATMKAIEDMKKLPELYGDHAFLVYAMTDGQENCSRNRSTQLSARLNELPDNWTTVCMVPDARGAHEAKKFGFPAANTQVWSTTDTGVETMGREFRSAMDTYMVGRSQGKRGTRDFFKADLSDVSVRDVQRNLTELAPNKYKLLSIRRDGTIRDLVETMTRIPYRKGCAFYELTKPVTVQDYKDIYVQNQNDGKIYGGDNARDLLGLPDHEIRLRPGDHGDWKIFVQSTSVNRKVIGGTSLLVIP